MRRMTLIKTIKLNSGITLILEHMADFKSSSVGIFCKTGAINEKSEEEGISHYIEHMLFKGTKNRTAFEIVDEIDGLGGEINAFTGKEKTCFYVKCLDNHLLTACDILTDMIENPLFDKDEMEKEKLVVIEEINMSNDEPDGVAVDVLEGNLFDGTTLAHPVLGSKESVSSFTQDLVRKYYGEHYTKDALVVSVAGSFNETEVVDFFNKKFERLPSKQRKDDFGVPSSAPMAIKVKKDIEQSHIVFGVRTVCATDNNRYKLGLISTLFGGGMSSRLFQSVRESKGLAYSVYSMNGFYNNTGAFVIYAGVAKSKVDDGKKAIIEEIKRLGELPISEKEFESAKEMMKANYIFSQESIKSRMTGNGQNFIEFGKCKTQDEMIEELESISLSDLEETKKLISIPENYFFVNVTGA
jgi:predicted Zn-dependent peptidase